MFENRADRNRVLHLICVGVICIRLCGDGRKRRKEKERARGEMALDERGNIMV